ncbi:MAG: hypothetical protein RJB01_1859 [Actinomycetota bacterium]
MFFGFFAYQLPLWACIVVALLPPLVVAVIFRLLAKPKNAADVDSASNDRYGRVIALLSTAFVFTVTFSTTNVWTQDSDIYSRANQLTQTTLAITQEIAHADPSQADESNSQLVQMMNALPFDVTVVSIQASDESIEQMREFQAWASSVNLGENERRFVDSLLGELNKDYRAWLTALNAPGVPDVMWILIATLGFMLIAAVAMLPRGPNSRSETTLLFAFAFIVGVMQIPLWVLNSMGFTSVLTESVFGQFTNAAPPIDRLAFGLALTAGLGITFWALLRLIARVRRKSGPPLEGD